MRFLEEVSRPIVMIGALVLLGSCSSDLFHGTEWSNRCAAEPQFKGCPVVVQGSDGGDGGSGGQGGRGGVGGDLGGAGGCIRCGEPLAESAPLIPNPGPLCAPDSADRWATLRLCACTNACAVQCAAACSGAATDTVCTACVASSCAAELTACEQD
jgi:hypothetical protein